MTATQVFMRWAKESGNVNWAKWYLREVNMLCRLHYNRYKFHKLKAVHTGICERNLILDKVMCVRQISIRSIFSYIHLSRYERSMFQDYIRFIDRNLSVKQSGMIMIPASLRETYREKHGINYRLKKDKNATIN